MNAFRCTSCGKLSNATSMPRAHTRAGATCGPFAEAVIGGEGSVIVDARPITPPDTYRQSLLRSFETCGLRTLHELRLAGDLSTGNVGSLAHLGSAMHAVFAQLLKDLRKTGHEQPTHIEASDAMHAVLAAGPWVLPADERDTLRELVLAFASYHRWPTTRILAIEERMSIELACPDGEIRTLTGQPDLLIARSSDTIEVTDHKSGWTRKDPRKAPEPGEPIRGLEYLSDRGHFQLDCYGVLVLHRYPAARRVTLCERYYRTGGPPREATLSRDELPEVERQIGLQMMLLDRAITEGDRSELWRPMPGRQCLRQCPIARSCPIPAEQRGLGALDSPEAADMEAERFVVVDALRQQQRDALKAFHEESTPTHAPQVGDGTGLFWREKSNGKGREFGVFPLEDFKPKPQLVAA